MANVLVQSGSVSCANKGKAVLSGLGKLTIGGSTAMLLTDTTAWSIAGCVSNKPCTKVLSVATGQSTKLTVGGTAVLLDSFTGNSDGDTPLVTADSAGQTKMTAV